MKKAVSRTGRNIGQMTVAGALIALIQAFNWFDWTPEQMLAVGGLLTLIVGFVQNWVEETTGKHFLEDPVAQRGADAYKPEVGG